MFTDRAGSSLAVQLGELMLEVRTSRRRRLFSSPSNALRWRNDASLARCEAGTRRAPVWRPRSFSISARRSSFL